MRNVSPDGSFDATSSAADLGPLPGGDVLFSDPTATWH